MGKKGKKRRKREKREKRRSERELEREEETPGFDPESSPEAGGESIRFAESKAQRKFAEKSFGQITKLVGTVAKSLRPGAAPKVQVLEQGPSAEEVGAAIEARPARAALGQNVLLLAGIAVAAMLFLSQRGAFSKRLQ